MIIYLRKSYAFQTSRLLVSRLCRRSLADYKDGGIAAIRFCQLQEKDSFSSNRAAKPQGYVEELTFFLCALGG
jgi:hypothetical protein